MDANASTNRISIYAGASAATNWQPLMNSGFNVLILNSLHFHGDGSIFLNDTEYVDASGNATSAAVAMGGAVAQLRTGGISQVLVSIGGGGSFPPDPNGINGWHSVSDSDFKAFSDVYWAANGMTSPLDNSIPILGSLETLLQTLGADGVDLDPEPMFYTYGILSWTTILLSEWASQNSHLVTWVPFQAQQSWQATAALLMAETGVPISWANLQPPAWNSGSDLTSWATDLGLGINNIVAGFEGGSPSSIQSALAGVVNGGTALTGAYFWNYEDIEGNTGSDTAADYAAAIIAGLAGTP